MKPRSLILTVSLALLFACSPKEQGTEESPPATPEASAPMPVPGEENVPEMIVEDEESAPLEGGESNTMPPVSEKRVIEIAADNWSFTPAAITAKQGEMLEVRLVGVGGVHGFAVPGLGINTPVHPGESLSVSIPTAEAGTYEFFCSIPCGAGHKDMRGTITITP